MRTRLPLEARSPFSMDRGSASRMRSRTRSRFEHLVGPLGLRLHVCHLAALALGLVFRLVWDRELDALVVRRREVETACRVWPLPFATSPVGSLGSPAASRSFLAISAISSGA